MTIIFHLAVFRLSAFHAYAKSHKAVLGTFKPFDEKSIAIDCEGGTTAILRGIYVFTVFACVYKC